MTDSILDQIIDSQKKSAISDFEPDRILNELLQLLDEREREVLNLRYGFSGKKKHTLEDIGKKFSITRERVRQIESAAVEKIKNSDLFNDKKDSLHSLIEETLDEVGGIMSEQKLFSKLGNLATNEEVESAIHFLINKLITEKLVLVKSNEKMEKSWATRSASVDQYEKVLDQIAKVLDTINEILSLEELHKHLHDHADYHDKEPMAHGIFENILNTSAKFKQNPFGHWGFKEWSLITPKRMNDKIYLVLKNHGKPMHFTDIADRINDTNFDHKKAHPATVHNELILDNDRYVLIGRGIYALKDWGYKAGVVTDIIQDIIKENGPMAKDEIIEAVLKQRMVKKSTIVLMLTNKKLFKKDKDGKYDLAE